MQLREIHIVSFGVLANARVRGIQPGLNVLYGPNEFGKTSLLELVRRILFGFPTRAMKANQYLLPGAEKNSGRLTCQLGDGRTLEVFRTTGKSGGPLTVTTADGSTVSEAAFATAIGHVSSDLFQNVFSLGLQELYDVDIVNLDEVKDRIYGAGLGGVSIPGLKSHFEKQATELFTKSGHKQRMKELARDIVSRGQSLRDEKDKLAQYDSKKNEHDRLKRAAEDLTTRVRTMQTQLRHLENQQRLFPTYLDMQRAQRQLTEMGEVPEVPDEALAELQNRQAAIKGLDERIESAREQIRLKKATLERINFDPALLRNEHELRFLSQNVARYRSNREELPSARQGTTDAQNLIEQKMAVLGNDWSEERVRSFALSAEQKDSLRQQESTLRDCEQSLDNSRRKLEVHTDSIRAAGTRQGVPKTIRLAGLVVLALGGTGCVLSALSGDTVVAAISGSVGLLGLLVALAPGSSTTKAHDPATEQYSADIRRAEENLEMARTEWSAVLKHLGLPPTLSPEAKDETLQLIGDLYNDFQHIDREKERAAHLQESLSSIDSRYAAVARDLRDPLPGDDVAAGIETLDERLAQARAQEVRRQSLAEEVLQREDELKGLDGLLEKEKTALSTLLSTYDVSSAAALREKYQRYQESLSLAKSIASGLQTIEATSGTGDARTSFIEALAITSPEETQAALEALRGHVEAAGNELAVANRNVGALDNELKALVSAEDLVSQEADVETLLQQLRDAYREWITARIALWGIGSAVSRYEQERQPDIIRAAQTAFVSMTDGRYERLLKPIDSDELHVRDRLGSDRTVNELSRGTREQLYLAMRMGLIAQYEQNAEPLPVVMDDILVNFDDERGPLAVKALAEFAEDRQVIVMTCHKNTVELYRQAGANELSVVRDDNLL